MDPVTVIGLVATAGQLIGLCVNAADGLHNLHTKQSRAGDSLLAIKRECTTLGAAVEGIKSWAQSPVAKSETRRTQCASLEEALKALMPSVELLADDVNKILSKGNDDGSLSAGGKIKYIWKEDEMKSHLDEVRWQSHHVHFLLTTTLNM
jgi:hypothetical protein